LEFWESLVGISRNLFGIWRILIGFGEKLFGISGNLSGFLCEAGWDSAEPDETSGRLDVRWKAINGAKSYVVECRTHGATPGAWQQVKITTSARYNATGVTPGQEYAFRVRAVGAAGEGPWSDEAVKMAS